MTTHTAEVPARVHSRALYKPQAHCNIVPRQATPFINRTYPNFIQNPELKYNGDDRYVTSHDATQRTPTDTATPHALTRTTRYPREMGREEIGRRRSWEGQVDEGSAGGGRTGREQADAAHH